MLINPDIIHRIVMEASSPEDKEYSKKLNKSEIHQVNAGLVSNLYNSILKNAVDYGDIPDSGGDITRIKNYNTRECLDTLKDLMSKNSIDEPLINEIQQCIMILNIMKPSFVEGFSIKNTYIMILYNSMVLSTLDATSNIIANYMDYLLGQDKEMYVSNNKYDRGRGTVAISNIKKFNITYKDGSLIQTVNYLLNSHKKNFLGEDAIISGMIIAGLLSIIPITRELVYFYYHSRVSISDFLKLQSNFLEANDLTVKSSTKSAIEKKDILRKQTALIKNMRRLADKISVNSTDIGNVVRRKTKEEEQLWGLNTIEKQVTKIATKEFETDGSLNFI